MVKRSIYISGAITGLDHKECKEKFAQMDRILKFRGFDSVINPMELGIPEKWAWEKAMDLCMNILGTKANAIIMLRDWKESKGAKKEFEHAMKHGYWIFFEDFTHQIEFTQELEIKSTKWIDTSELEFP